MSATAAATPPLRNSYWVVPGQVLAGEYPTGRTPEKTRERLQKLLDVGIECFVDLTNPNEMPSYEEELPPGIDYIRRPIKDHSVPTTREQMAEVLARITDSLRVGRPVYVHCRAGIGRTGMTIGCLLVERGFSGDQALEELNHLWQKCRRATSWPFIPETDEQANYVRGWTAALSGAATAAGGIESLGLSSLEPPPGNQRSRAAAGPDPIAIRERDPLLDPATLAAARGLRDRFLGAFVGLAIGDALAAATQFKRRGSFTPVGDLLGGGPFDLPRGGWSDDTAMTLCLAESLLKCNGFDARDQVQRYGRWQQEGYLSATGQCLGITANTARALAVAKWRRQVFAGSHDPDQLDPEPLSRVVAPVLFFFPSLDEAVQQAADASRTTCQAPVVLDACRTLARALHAALSGRSKSTILGDTPVPEAQPRGNATAPSALAAALWAFGSTGNFRDAVLAAANVGGHSDVVAAVCGQLAGAHYGVAAIPPPWRNSLIHKDLIENYADGLLQAALVSLGTTP